MACGASHTAAIRADGTVATWGGARKGVSILAPPDLGPARSVRCRNSATLILLEDGTLRIWGCDARLVAEVSDPAASATHDFIAVGNRSAIARRADGKFVLWRGKSPKLKPIDGPPGRSPIIDVAFFGEDDEITAVDAAGNVWSLQVSRDRSTWTQVNTERPIRLIAPLETGCVALRQVSADELIAERRAGLEDLCVRLESSSALGFGAASEAIARCRIALGQPEVGLKYLNRAIELCPDATGKARLESVRAQCTAALEAPPSGAEQSLSVLDATAAPCAILLGAPGRPISPVQGAVPK